MDRTKPNRQCYVDPRSIAHEPFKDHHVPLRKIDYDEKKYKYIEPQLVRLRTRFISSNLPPSPFSSPSSLSLSLCDLKNHYSSDRSLPLYIYLRSSPNLPISSLPLFYFFLSFKATPCSVFLPLCFLLGFPPRAGLRTHLISGK